MMETAGLRARRMAFAVRSILLFPIATLAKTKSFHFPVLVAPVTRSWRGISPPN